MRLSAYKKAIDEAKKLPDGITELNYFNECYNPRGEAINYILKMARLDVNGLFESEYIQLTEYTRDNIESKDGQV